VTLQKKAQWGRAGTIGAAFKSLCFVLRGMGLYTLQIAWTAMRRRSKRNRYTESKSQRIQGQRCELRMHQDRDIRAELRASVRRRGSCNEIRPPHASRPEYS
jgi:hypothetical protein